MFESFDLHGKCHGEIKNFVLSAQKTDKGLSRGRESVVLTGRKFADNSIGSDQRNSI